MATVYPEPVYCVFIRVYVSGSIIDSGSTELAVEWNDSLDAGSQVWTH